MILTACIYVFKFMYVFMYFCMDHTLKLSVMAESGNVSSSASSVVVII
jgi:hypothetical protein